MSNIRHIAKMAGVSITTVSRVMNNVAGVSQAAREAVLAAVNQAGYVPEVGRRSTSNIALLYTDVPTLDSPFDAALLVGIYEGLQKLGYDLMVLDAHRSPQPGESYSHMFLRKGVKGALIRTTTSTQSICQEIHREGFPCVVMGYRFEPPALRCVYSDSREASGKAMEHLIALGHRRIAICIHVVEDSDHADRVEAYRSALTAHQIPFDERLVIRVQANREGGIQAVRRVVTLPDSPTALFLADPLISVGVLCEARRLGLQVPGDLSIVGVDDAELRYALVPQMTSVCQDTKALGREAVMLLAQAIEGREGEANTNRALRCWFEVHESTSAHADAPSQETPSTPPLSRSRRVAPRIPVLKPN